MDIPSLDSVAGVVTGVAGGSVAVGWVTRLLIKRFIQENDSKHALAAKAIQSIADAQSKAYRRISEKLNQITVDIEVIKTRMGEVINIRDDVKANSKDVAIALERIVANAEDIDAGFSSVRRELTEMKRSNIGR